MLSRDLTEQGALPNSKSGVPASRFCHVGPPFDQLLHDIARDVRSTIARVPVRQNIFYRQRRAFKLSGATLGYTVVYKIKPVSTSSQHISNSHIPNSRLPFGFDVVKTKSISLSSSTSVASAFSSFLFVIFVVVRLLFIMLFR